MSFVKMDDMDGRIVWSLSIRDADSGVELYDHEASRVLKAASIGKLILLAYVGAEVLAEPGLASERLNRDSVEPVADSGLWQHLSADTLTIADVTTLVFAASDNWATNVLLHRFGLDAVERFRPHLQLSKTVLLDFVRGERHAHHPPTLSRASAGELSALMSNLWRGQVLRNPRFCEWFVAGLALSLDLSMIGAPLGLNPLTHPGPEAHLGIANKTGTDVGVRGDTGILSAGGRRYAYACIANYEEGIELEENVTAKMQDIGRGLLRDDSGGSCAFCCGTA